MTVAELTAASTLDRGRDWFVRNSRTIALAAVVLAGLLATAYALVQGGTLKFYDEQEYLDLTRSMAQGHGFSENGVATAYRPPGYPMLLVPFYLVGGGSVAVLRLAGVLALAGSVWLAYLLGRRMRSSAVGALASVVMAVYPLLIYTATTLYPQVPAMFFLLLAVEFSLRVPKSEHPWRPAAVAGLASGALTLIVPTFVPSIAIVVVALAWRYRRRAVIGALALLVIVAAVLPVAWCVRNALVMHAFVPVATNNGNNLLLGNSDHVSAGGGRVGDISAYEKVAQQQGMNEVQQDDYYRQAAVDWITSHPGKAAQLYAGKVANTFSFRNELATAGAGDPMKDLVSALSYYPILALAVLRLLLFKRFPLRGTEKLMAVLIVANVLVLAVFFTRLRLRIPLDGLTILLAAAAVGCLVTGWRSRRERTA